MENDLSFGDRNLEQALLDLLVKLTNISQHHQDLFDSEVRDKMAQTVFHGFLKPTESFTVPTDHGLSSIEGNLLIRDSLDSYIKEASALATAQGLDFHRRLDAFQNYKVKIVPFSFAYDSFFGHFMARCFDQDGNQIQP